MYRLLILLLSAGVLNVSCMSKKAKSVEINAADKSNTESVAEFVENSPADNKFAFELFKTVNRFEKEGDNILVSPISVDFALSMVANGAVGSTREEILGILHRTGGMDYANLHSYSLRQFLLSADEETDINIANSIWFRNGVNINPQFISVLDKYYSASAREVDFGAPGTVAKINGWCSDNTNGKISKIVEFIPADAIMYLINAVYFKGMWAIPFDKNMTSQAVFHSPQGDQTVNMMQNRGTYGMASDDNCVYVELPYGNGSFSMVVVLPNENVSVDDAAEFLDGSGWNDIMERLSQRRIDLSLPRFKFEGSYGLHEEVLPYMGMRRAFESSADFSGISGDFPLMISTVIHKTYVEVNEEGTEAAAVTSIGISRTSVEMIPRITIDRPFLCVIRDRANGSILFIGKINSVD